jgi:histidinol-phosphate aminotransferase
LPDEFRRMEGNSYETAFSADDFTPQLDKLAELIEESENVSGVYLDNPNNPTGKALDQEKIRSIIEVAEKKGILVVIDEAYGDFLTDEQSGMKYVQMFDNVLVVRSMSKGYGLARDRIGYAL